MCMKRSNKYALMSAALLAGAVSFSSCSNDEDGAASYDNGKKAEAQMAISFQRFAKTGRGTAGDANLGVDGKTPTLLQPIKNLVILPSKNGAVGSITNLGAINVDASGNITTEGLTQRTANVAEKSIEYYSQRLISLTSGTDRIQFFGGDVMEDNGTSLKTTVGLETYTSEEETTLEIGDGKGMTTGAYSKMPKLYYYGSDGQLEVSTNAYSAAGEMTWSDGPVGESTKSVRVDGIEYAVGVLQATVQQGVGAKSLFVTDNATIGDLEFENGDLKIKDELVAQGVNENEAFEIVGYIIKDQQESVNVGGGFIAGENKGEGVVYDAAVANTDGNRYITKTASTAVNYTRLFETAILDKQPKVRMVLRCKNVSGSKMAIKNVSDGNGGYAPGFVENNGYFYLLADLVAENGTANGALSIIDQDYTTTANFTINNFFNAYNEDPEITNVDATVGVVVNLEWKPGYTFNVDID